MFVHFSIGTFSDEEWADPDTPPSVFNPSATVDPDHWAVAMRSAGMSYGVLTAKHHDGFALWPTDTSAYGVASSPYQSGQGDIVRDFVNALRERGLGVGLYFSIWDRHNGETPDLIKDQLRELLTSYGTIDYLWFDGWGWAMGGGAQYDAISYQPVRDFIRDLSPTTLVANNDHLKSTATSDLPVYEVPIDGFPPDDSTPKDTVDTLDSTNNWFHTSLSGPPKSASTIEAQLTQVNASNGQYLLNVPPDRSGRITRPYLERLVEIGQRSMSRPSTD